MNYHLIILTQLYIKPTYSPVSLLPSSYNVLYLLLIYTFFIMAIVIAHGTHERQLYNPYDSAAVALGVRTYIVAQHCFLYLKYIIYTLQGG